MRVTPGCALARKMEDLHGQYLATTAPETATWFVGEMDLVACLISEIEFDQSDMVVLRETIDRIKQARPHRFKFENHSAQINRLLREVNEDLENR
jgi:hypothetical protein